MADAISQAMAATRRNPDTPQLSVVLPVFNEAATLAEIIARIQSVGIDCEIIIVDDASTDGTSAILNQSQVQPNIRVLRQPTNQGKGAAVRSGLATAKGKVVILQDADLEYHPEEYPALIAPIVDGAADVVYGSRFMPGSDAHISRLTYWANRFITWAFNHATGQKFTDVETCYKAFRNDVVQQIAPALVEDRFGMEIEITARLCKIPGIRITERPIRYRARRRDEGKKIGWTDGVRALWCIWKYR